MTAASSRKKQIIVQWHGLQLPSKPAGSSRSSKGCPIKVPVKAVPSKAVLVTTPPENQDMIPIEDRVWQYNPCADKVLNESLPTSHRMTKLMRHSDRLREPHGEIEMKREERRMILLKNSEILQIRHTNQLKMFRNKLPFGRILRSKVQNLTRVFN